MKLEAGKFYKTRDGSKAYVACIEPPFRVDSDERVCGYVESSQSACTWCTDGSWIEVDTSPQDLVAEWVESKPRLRAWFNDDTGAVTLTNNPSTGHWRRAPWLDEPEET
jgi:hypothetical protein